MSEDPESSVTRKRGFGRYPPLSVAPPEGGRPSLLEVEGPLEWKGLRRLDHSRGVCHLELRNGTSWSEE